MPTAVDKRLWVPWSVADARDPLESDLFPVLQPEDFHRLAKDDDWQEAEKVRCQLDPWYWRVNYVVTQDEHWVTKGYKTAYHRWPCLEYERSCTHVLWKYTHTAWPKSRQMMMSWRVVTQMLGDALFTGGRLYMIQSQREGDAKRLLARGVGVYERMRSMAPWLGPKVKRQNDSEIAFGNDSTIIAVPSGAHYVQGHTPAWWFSDETQIQDGAEEAYYQALPACERITLVGTPDYGWFFQEFLCGRAA